MFVMVEVDWLRIKLEEIISKHNVDLVLGLRCA